MEYREEGRLHAVAVERVLARLRLVQALVGDVHDLLQDLANVLERKKSNSVNDQIKDQIQFKKTQSLVQGNCETKKCTTLGSTME